MWAYRRRHSPNLRLDKTRPRYCDLQMDNSADAANALNVARQVSPRAIEQKMGKYPDVAPFRHVCSIWHQRTTKAQNGYVLKPTGFIQHQKGLRCLLKSKLQLLAVRRLLRHLKPLLLQLNHQRVPLD